jgi:hypothetical protein
MEDIHIQMFTLGNLVEGFYIGPASHINNMGRVIINVYVNSN